MLEKATTLKRFKYSLLSKSLEKQTNVIKQTEFNNEKKDVRGKLLKIIIGTVVKNWENAENAFFFQKTGTPICWNGQNMENKMLTDIKQQHVSILTLWQKVTNTDEMYKMINESNN